LTHGHSQEAWSDGSSGNARGDASDEGSVFGAKDLCEVQNHTTPRRGIGDLRESQAQAAAGMMFETRN
jgi:hypothetical protein